MKRENEDKENLKFFVIITFSVQMRGNFFLLMRFVNLIKFTSGIKVFSYNSYFPI